MLTASLLSKYDRPVPRYTSYPTVPHWDATLDLEKWESNFSQQFAIENSQNGISLYIHLPFCESLCTYCGCNKKITTNHKVETEYIHAVLKEWTLYLRLMQEKPIIRELHLGGGTPTFFSPENLQKLLNPILSSAIIVEDHAFSFEGHPNNTTYEHLKILYDLGFRRVSFGVQDNDPVVQQIINRIQPFYKVQEVSEIAREIGYTSINFDLIYGLPKQTPESMERTLQKVLSLRPDRVAFYSYAHVPWTSKGQRLFDENDLPSAEVKMQLYRLAKFQFALHGYHDIGMDHFALPTDELYIARWREREERTEETGNRKWEESRLHRNFMGYTTQSSKLLIGLGVSSISDTGNAYAQNNKTIREYYDSIKLGRLAITKGYFLDEEDQKFKQYILDISCKGATGFLPEHLLLLEEYCFPVLKELAADGLIDWDTNGLKLTVKGHHFIRIVCSAFDLFIQRKKHQQTTAIRYSKAI
jgi:oxygen-independent coproporphyrinogen-3 oxidase